MSRKQATIAAFDFDDTLIAADTLPDFLRHSCSLPLFLLHTIQALPLIISFKLHIIDNDVAKEKLLTIFLRNMSQDHFSELCDRYKQRLDKLANPIALERVKWHQERGDEVVIISASAEGWIRPWAQEHNIQNVIATTLEVDDSRKLTGKLSGLNCHGPEKVERFLAQYPNRPAYTLYAYGDGGSDQQMFKLADFVFERKFE